MKKPWALVAAGLSLLGMAIMIYLTLLHFSPSGEAVCDVSSTFSCDIVTKSAYSELMGIPNAFLGALFFAFFALFFFLASRGKPPFLWRAASFFAALFAVLYGSYLTAIEAFVLKTYCLFCLLSFTLFVMLFVVIAQNFGGEVWRKVLAYFKGEI